MTDLAKQTYTIFISNKRIHSCKAKGKLVSVVGSASMNGPNHHELILIDRFHYLLFMTKEDGHDSENNLNIRSNGARPDQIGSDQIDNE